MKTCRGTERRNGQGRNRHQYVASVHHILPKGLLPTDVHFGTKKHGVLDNLTESGY